MNMKQTTSEFSRITRISGAAALIAFSGSALALAEPAPRPAPTDAPAPDSCDTPAVSLSEI